MKKLLHKKKYIQGICNCKVGEYNLSKLGLYKWSNKRVVEKLYKEIFNILRFKEPLISKVF
jgi:hypothetical protein